MELNFKGKVVAVTGAGAGIGRAAAMMYAQSGAKVVVNSRSHDTGAETVRLIKEAGGDAVFVQGNVAVEDAAKKIIDTAIQVYGKIDILVNNAGIVKPGSVDELEEAVIDEVLAVNVKGTIFTSKYAVKFMKEHGGGSIVHVASAACLYGCANRSIYTASKGAILALTKGMAIDHAKQNIRVNAICPGATLSPSMLERFEASGDADGMKASFIQNHPIGRLAQPEEMAAGILYASSDEASFMTGIALPIDGGVSL